MELDELKEGWAILDRRLSALEVSLVAGRAVSGVRSELRPLRWGQAVQAVLGAGLARAAGSFWVDNRDAAGPLVAGLLLHAYGIAMIVAAARNLVLAARATETAPVLTLQKRVAELRAWRIREGYWFGVVGCFMWVPMLVWGFAWLGVDIVAARPVFMAFNVLAGFLCLGGFLFLSRYIKAPEGGSVRRAGERLEELARFTDSGPV
jgi:hypothetical protein